MSYSKSGGKASPMLDVKNFHLLNYASHEWDQHSRLQSCDDVSREVALLECEDARIDWLQIVSLQNDSRHRLDFSARDSHCTSSICYAVLLRLSRVVEELLAAGQDANDVGLYLTPLLVSATANEDRTTVELLLAHGANVNMASTHPMEGNALWCAASRGLLLTKLLVGNGADVNRECLQGTALSAACRANDQSVVKFFLERGARVNNVDSEGCTALITASECGHPEIVKLLFAEGAELNHPNTHTTPLGAAAGFGRTDVMTILVDAGADLDARDSSALLEALMGGHEHAVIFLEAKGAKKLTIEQLNKTLIRVCNNRFHQFPKKAVQLLLDRGADVSAGDSSALLDAMRSGHENTVALLEAKGAIKPTLKQLKDALVKVRRYGFHWNRESAVQMLLDHGADDNAADSETSLIA